MKSQGFLHQTICQRRVWPHSITLYQKTSAGFHKRQHKIVPRDEHIFTERGWTANSINIPMHAVPTGGFHFHNRHIRSICTWWDSNYSKLEWTAAPAATSQWFHDEIQCFKSFLTRLSWNMDPKKGQCWNWKRQKPCVLVWNPCCALPSQFLVVLALWFHGCMNKQLIEDIPL